ncbi:HAD hydrolase-like protein [Iodidimonas sp. SYSU 1G8]|uniref:HAD hydrolase-like protein n=1 Tax=Iodidimonas sp. SYSU 1G8 TaxID=3133967 RepID=UPI0031FEA3F6
MIDTLFIDLDGTLTDPKPGITGSVRYALDKLGMPVAEDHSLDWIIGPPMQESLVQLTGSDALAAAALQHYRDRFGTIGLFENAVYPGIPESLAALRAMGLRLHLATSKPWVYAERILEHFDLARFFDSVFGSELDGTNIRKTDLLPHAIARTGADPARGLMIGDRKHDVLGALHVGLTPVGVLYGYGDREELVGAGARRLIERPAEMAGLVTPERRLRA